MIIPAVASPGRTRHKIHPLTPDARGQWPGLVVIMGTTTERGPENDSPERMVRGYAQLWARGSDGERGRYSYVSDVIADTPEQFWDAIDGWTRHRLTMRIYSHDPRMDLGVTYAFANLTRLGYNVDFSERGGSSLNPEGELWLRVKRGHRGSVSVADSASVLGHAGVPGLAVHVGKHEQRPPEGEPTSRLRYDVEVVAAALMGHLYPWLADHHCNPKRVSGPGLGYSVMRTNHYDLDLYGPLMWHGDEQLWQAEAEAGGGGRIEAWRHGLVEGPLEEWDYTNGHPTICLDRLPYQACEEGYYDPANPDRYMHLHRVLIRTDQPVVPYNHPRHGAIFPVGTFQATLWGDELAEAQALGAEVLEHRGQWAYRAAPVLRGWAEWVLDELESPDVDPVMAPCLKQWSQTLVGKLGQRHSKVVEATGMRPFQGEKIMAQTNGILVCEQHGWEELPPMYVSRLLFVDTGDTKRIYAIDDETMDPTSESCPSIMSYVMSKQRVKLLKAMRTAGLDEVVHVNTDGLIVTKKGADRLRRKRITGLRKKKAYPEGVVVFGKTSVDPVKVEHSRKIAGLKPTAVLIRPGVYEQTELQQIRGGGVRKVVRTIRVQPTPLGRTRQADGLTAPHIVKGR